MDGNLLKRELRDLLNEAAASNWYSAFTAFNNIWEGAVEFVSRTKCLRTTQTITTVAEQSEYQINADYLELYLRDSSNRHFIPLDDGTSVINITECDYQTIVYSNNTTSVEYPDRFAITDDDDLPTVITGTATSTGASSGGESNLYDTSSSTKFATVSAGDVVNNTTDGSYGIVLQNVSNTQLKTALFEGTNDDWTALDAYVIQPQGRYKLVLDPPPSTSGYTITLHYVQKPAPVFSDYGVYRFPSQYGRALVKYAFWLYKYRDSEPQVGDAMYQYFDAQCRKFSMSVNSGLRPKSRMPVNMKARY